MSPKVFLKKAIKRLITPAYIIAVHLSRVKVFDRHVFMNRYTRKIPLVDRAFKLINSKTIQAHSANRRYIEYAKWVKANYPSPKAIHSQKKAQRTLPIRPLISILLPTYNTNAEHLRECIESVQNQSYDNWELCIADDASTDKSVQKTIKKLAAKDKRINYVLRKSNGHICKATNSALKLAKGDYVALLDHDDKLWPNALYEVVKTINKNPKAKFIYSDEEKISENGKEHKDPFFKPDWSFEFLRSINYITHFSVLDRRLVNKVGGFRPGYEGAQDWDLFLRISRETNEIFHIPTVLYSWRMTDTSTAKAPSAKDYAYINQKKALQDDIKARELKADIEWQIPFSMWRVQYKLPKEPKISIVIPTKNQLPIIKQCLQSILDKTTYKNYEIIIVDTGSDDKNVWGMYDSYKSNLPLKVVEWKKEFNFSAACNFGAENATGQYYLFLNNDTEVITPTWLQDMVGYASQDNVGSVGAKLYYPDGRLQHGGIILGVGGVGDTPGVAGHFFPAYLENPPQDPGQLLYDGGTRNFTAVTAACVMVGKDKFNRAKGFDPKFKIAFNDVDFCLKLYDTGLRNVYLPHVELFHHESISIGKLGSKVRDPELFTKEIKMMIDKWGDLIKDDPFYHPEFRRDIANARLDV